MQYWADHYIRLLNQGKTVQFRSHEKSMGPNIEEGVLVTVVPINFNQLQVGDYVLCKIERTHYLRRIRLIYKDQIQVGDNRNQINGWTKIVYGKVIKIER